MDYICHYGIKGMKWGVRRYQNPDGSLTEAGRKRAARQERRRANSERRAKVRAEKKDRRRANRDRYILSEEELARRIARLEKEKKLRMLTESEISPGRTAVKEVLSDSGKSITKNVATGTGTYVVKTAMETSGWRGFKPKQIAKSFDLFEAANYVKNPAKKK